MRDPKRIEKVLGQIRQIWETCPDLRLGQLLLNVASDPLLYNIEDDELIKRLQDTYFKKEEDNDREKESV